MILRTLLAALAVVLTLGATAPPLPTCRCNALPSFQSFETPPERVTSPALDLSSHPIGPKFQTLLRRAVQTSPPNLAGHFLVVEWGCGTACQMFAIVDLETGGIWHDSNRILTRGVATRADSRLVVLNPVGESFGESLADRLATTYYVWRGDRMEPLCGVKYSLDDLRLECDGVPDAGRGQR